MGKHFIAPLLIGHSTFRNKFMVYEILSGKKDLQHRVPFWMLLPKLCSTQQQWWLSYEGFLFTKVIMQESPGLVTLKIFQRGCGSRFAALISSSMAFIWSSHCSCIICSSGVVNLRILTEDGVAATNEKSDFLCNCLCHLMIRIHNFPSVSHYSHSTVLQAICCMSHLLIHNCSWTCDAAQTSWTGTSFVCCTPSEASAVFPSPFISVAGKIWC